MLVLTRRRGEKIMIENDPVELIDVGHFGAVLSFRGKEFFLRPGEHWEPEKNLRIFLVKAVKGGKCRIGFEAPNNVNIYRLELGAKN